MEANKEKEVWEIVNKERKKGKRIIEVRNEDMEKIFHETVRGGGGRKGGGEKKEKGG